MASPAKLRITLLVDVSYTGMRFPESMPWTGENGAEPFDTCIDNNGTYTKYLCNESMATMGTYLDATCNSLMTNGTQITSDTCVNATTTTCAVTGTEESCVGDYCGYRGWGILVLVLLVLARELIFRIRTLSVCWFGW